MRPAPANKERKGQLVFEPTAAVATSREQQQYVDCSVCNVDNSEYLFHRVGVRFVRCKTCGTVYVNPIGPAGPNYLDLSRSHDDASKERFLEDYEAFLSHLADVFERKNGALPKRTLLVGRYFTDIEALPSARRLSLAVLPTSDEQFAAFVERNDVGWIDAHLSSPPDLVILDELLEATPSPGILVETLVKRAPDAWFAIGYANADSLPARVMRRYWSQFFDHKRAFLSTNSLCGLFARFGFSVASQFAFPTHMTLGHVADRVFQTRMAQSRVMTLSVPARTGARIAVFRKRQHQLPRDEKLSIIIPVFNEVRYCAQLIDAVLAKPLSVPREIIIVESNSTDGTRDVVKQYVDRPDVRVIFEEKPRGKGHAVRTGLAAVTGTIILIQDADFEYDIDDYDALLEPILQRRTAFVLGSRSLGLDDWKVRRFEGTPLKRLVLNVAQVGFAKTFNALYQQRTTDVNTMFKVFRTECLEGVDLESDRFSLDIELVCKLVKNGYAPIEVPVNYVARGFEEGKKISFVKDALPSYFAFFKYRFED